MKLGQLVQIAPVALRATALGTNLRSLPLIRHPRKLVTYSAASLFLYKQINGQMGIPQRNVHDVLPASNVEEIALGALKFGENWLMSESSYIADIVNLSLICRILKPKTVFEIGTFRGYTAFQFALNTPDDAKIYTLDLPKEGTVARKLKTTGSDEEHVGLYTESRHYWFENSEVASKITCLFGDSAGFDFSPYHRRVDFFFIDGAHSYEYVRSDTLHALKCCHPGSVIAWHDFGRVGINGVSRWILELSRRHEIYSIPGGSVAFMVVT